MFHELARDEALRLETRRLWLRWPRAADAPAVCALAGDAATSPPENTEKFIRVSREDNARGAALRLALTLKSGARETVGAIGVENRDGRPTLFYWLGRPFCGQGFIGEAAAVVIHAFFLFTDGEELGAIVAEENAASRGVLDRLGFVAVERQAGRQAQNPGLRLALRRRDWRARGGFALPPGLASVTA